MQRPQELAIMFSKYMGFYPDEIERQKSFKTFIENTSFENLYNRKNFIGHITASAFIVNPNESTLLLIHHKILNRWLQPGGHVDVTDESILEAAFREIEEETNIERKHLKFAKTTKSHTIPIDIDSHIIPRNSKKNEDQHVHHDIRFLFLFGGSNKIDINRVEIKDYTWKSFSELKNDETFSNIITKVKLILKA